VTEKNENIKDKAAKIRQQMGGLDRLKKMKSEGKPNIREHIDSVLDENTFTEIGTFSRSLREEERDSTPGDGKIGGEGKIDGRPVAVVGDDITVKRGSSSIVGSRKTSRLYQRALKMGFPYIYFGETGGGRIPDLIGSEGISDAMPSPDIAQRRRMIPMASVIVGQSFGGSSFQSAFSDFTVQVKGSVLAVTSPRVFEIATGEIISFEELGGVDVHAKLTGQIDLGVESYEEAYAAVRRWLTYLRARLPAHLPTCQLTPASRLARRLGFCRAHNNRFSQTVPTYCCTVAPRDARRGPPSTSAIRRARPALRRRCARVRLPTARQLQPAPKHQQAAEQQTSPRAPLESECLVQKAGNSQAVATGDKPQSHHLGRECPTHVAFRKPAVQFGLGPWVGSRSYVCMMPDPLRRGNQGTNELPTAFLQKWSIPSSACSAVTSSRFPRSAVGDLDGSGGNSSGY